MSTPSVLELPSARDYFRLNGETSMPAILTSGGEAADKIEDQGQLLTRGASTIDRQVLNATLTYKLRMWLPGHFTVRDRWAAMFLAGRLTNPVRAYDFGDLRAPWISKVIFEKLGPEEAEKPGGPYFHMLTLHQYVRVKAAGGAVKPTDALDATLKSNEAQIKALSGALAAAKGAKPK